jgi:hypothetical protein
MTTAPGAREHVVRLADLPAPGRAIVAALLEAERIAQQQAVASPALTPPVVRPRPSRPLPAGAAR